MLKRALGCFGNSNCSFLIRDRYLSLIWAPLNEVSLYTPIIYFSFFTTIFISLRQEWLGARHPILILIRVESSCLSLLRRKFSPFFKMIITVHRYWKTLRIKQCMHVILLSTGFALSPNKCQLLDVLNKEISVAPKNKEPKTWTPANVWFADWSATASPAGNMGGSQGPLFCTCAWTSAF